LAFGIEEYFSFAQARRKCMTDKLKATVPIHESFGIAIVRAKLGVYVIKISFDYPEDILVRRSKYG
jgi:hypothetical protein